MTTFNQVQLVANSIYCSVEQPVLYEPSLLVCVGFATPSLKTKLYHSSCIQTNEYWHGSNGIFIYRLHPIKCYHVLLKYVIKMIIFIGGYLGSEDYLEWSHNKNTIKSDHIFVYVKYVINICNEFFIHTLYHTRLSFLLRHLLFIPLKIQIHRPM